MLATLAMPLLLLAQQHQIAERLAGRVSPDIASVAVELGNEAAARGLPLDPLVQKAIEGNAKRVPAQRVAQALRVVVAQLDTAAAALRLGRADLAADTVAVAAGAFALSAGLTSRDVAALARAGGRAGETIVGLRVAGTLTALGVPGSETVNLVRAKLRAGRPTSELLSLPGQVQAQMARGVAPAQAAAGLARAAAAQSRRGPPPGRGQPPPHPGPPPQD